MAIRKRGWIRSNTESIAWIWLARSQHPRSRHRVPERRTASDFHDGQNLRGSGPARGSSALGRREREHDVNEQSEEYVWFRW